MAVFMATMKPGDRVLSMDLSNGGHLSHGSPVNFSGLYFDVKSYGINEFGEIDYEDVRKMAIEHKPKLIICGASNYSKVIDFKKFREIADEVGALLLADIAHIVLTRVPPGRETASERIPGLAGDVEVRIFLHGLQY